MLCNPAVGKVNRGPCSPDAVQCSYSDWARPSMTERHRGLAESKREKRTMNSTEFHKLKLTMSLEEFCGPNMGSLSLCQRISDPGPAYWFRFTPVGTSFLPHQGDKKGATMPHKPITPFHMALIVCGLTAAPCPYLYEHRQSRPGVTQAVLYVLRFIHSTRKWSRLAGNVRVLELPFSTKISDCVVPHTFVQPIDCLMSPIRIQVARIGYQEPPGGGKV